MLAETTSASTQPPPVSRRITEQDRLALASAGDYLARGVALKHWWNGARAADKAGRGPGEAGGFTQRFKLTRTFNPADESFGFFGDTLVGGGSMPIMGNFQKMFYDRPRTPPGGQQRGIDWMRDQLREFILRYFMRVSSFKQPEAYVEGSQHDVPGWLAPFSLCTKSSAVTQGFGFKQLFYKRRGGGIGEFPEDERFAIVDLREIGEKYEWILVYVDLFDFKFTLQPLGPNGPEISLPIKEGSYLVLSGDFVENLENPAPGVLGRYGFGYAFIKNPAPGVVAFGPGEFDAAFETIVFEVHDSAGPHDPGSVDVEMVFVVNRPERVVNVSLDPLGWGMRMADVMSFGMTSRLLAPVRGSFNLLPRSASIDPVFAFFDLANLLTGGRAKEELCLSREQIEFTFLLLHFMQHYTMANGSLLVWRQVADWRDPACVPLWAKLGTPVP